MDGGDKTTRPKRPLRMRNSIATTVVIPAKLILPMKPHAASASTSSSSQSFAPVDFELISIKPSSYTSLKDILPSTAVQSPTGAAASGCRDHSGYDISIRNRLVKRAAWAYLRPVSASPDSGGRDFLRRVRDSVCSDSVAVFLRFITRIVARAFDHLLRVVRVRSSK